MNAKQLNCDLVLKGGVTSGVVYPKLIARLAERYDLRSIGGTSVGALAAAVAAAAAFRRTSKSSEDGFAAIGELAEELAEEVEKGKSRLFTLFQPTRETRRLFGIGEAALNRRGPRHLLGALAMASLKNYWKEVLAGSVPGWAFLLVATIGARSTPPDFPAAMLWIAGIVGAVVLGTVGAVVGAALGISRDVRKHLPPQGFGLCTGLSTGGSGRPALTDWLHQTIQANAGVPDNRPLTLGDLWAGRLLDDDERAAYQPPVDKAIDLVTITTAATLQRPFRLPFEEREFFFDPLEWAKLFPAQVMDWLVTHEWSEQHDDIYRFNGHPVTHREPGRAPRKLLALPSGQDLPIIVLVRLSLSFPVLMSSVPLYRVDFTRRRIGELRRSSQRHRPLPAKRVWFTDGGVCSNFPIHLFDAPLPRWPTFGLDLALPHPDYPIEHGSLRNRIYRPEGLDVGAEQYFPNGSQQTRWSSLTEFFSSVFGAAKTYRDHLQSVAPGSRDRIIRIRLLQEEGGLNLNMPADDLRTLSASGRAAAERIISDFAGEAPDNAWLKHRVVRLKVLLANLQRYAEKLEAEQTSTEAIPAFDLDAVLQEIGPPLRDPANEALSTFAAFEALEELLTGWEKDMTLYPMPVLEIRPRV
jgi:predicted acylesterase/phospholipase RssA